MLLSEILLKKASEEDDTELYKFASSLQFTYEDKDVLEKDAGLWSSIGSAVLKSNTLRNAAMSGVVGAAGGALTAKEGEGVSGAIKGGLIGAAAGGLGTAAGNINQRMNKGLNFNQAVAGEGRSINRAFQSGNKVNAGNIIKHGPSTDPTMPSAIAAKKLASTVNPIKTQYASAPMIGMPQPAPARTPVKPLDVYPGRPTNWG